MLLNENELLNACEWLVQNGGPSIKYRTLTEILGLDINDSIVQETYKEILNSKRLKFISSRQKENGCFGEKSFHHGTDSGETYLRELFEMGVSPKHEVLHKGIEYAKVLHITKPESTSWITAVYLESIGRAGKSQLALDWYREYSERFSLIYKNHREDWLIVKNGKPATYYLEIPFMYVIRTISNSWWWLKEYDDSSVAAILDFLLNDMAEVKDLYWIAPNRQLFAYSNFLHVIASNSISLRQPSVIDFIMSLEGLWLLAQFGIIEEYPNLKNVFSFISSKKNDDGLWEFPIDGVTKTKSSWHSYHGFSLEENWRKKESPIAELTFRVCLISERNRKSRGIKSQVKHVR